ncbi:MAG: hypothetical protein AAGF13_07625, partial [Pseudomonadota bacterium]
VAEISEAEETASEELEPATKEAAFAAADEAEGTSDQETVAEAEEDEDADDTSETLEVAEEVQVAGMEVLEASDEIFEDTEYAGIAEVEESDEPVIPEVAEVAEVDADGAEAQDQLAAFDDAFEVEEPQVIAEAAEVDAVSEEDDSIDAEENAAEQASDDAVEPEAEEGADAPAPGSLAAKLRRIQAVVGASKAFLSPSKPSTYTEDEHAEDFSETADEVKAEEPEVTVEEAVAPEPEVEERPRVLRMKRADFDAAMANAKAAAEQDQEEVDEDDSEVTSIFAEPEVTELDASEQIETSLSPEDEADLMAELAAAEAEAQDDIEEQVFDEPVVHEEVALSEDAQDESVESTSEAAVADDAEETAAPEEAPAFEDQEATMSRLMDEAAAQLDEPDAKSRRDAYSHLKAAVAAKEAARTLGEGENEEDREGEYRNDLAKVVRPRRAEKPTDGPRTERPAAAPLKLVASQRVDVAPEEPAQSAEPVRPRRVATQQLAPSQDVTGFAAFASQAGADALPDILEAAAAYVTHVEGNETFSRPQMMRTVKQAMAPGSFTREDGLRAFGTLLRQGRINKIRGGQFEVTANTRYQPEARDVQQAAG